jgi:hypothetical protein
MTLLYRCLRPASWAAALLTITSGFVLFGPTSPTPNDCLVDVVSLATSRAFVTARRMRDVALKTNPMIPRPSERPESWLAGTWIPLRGRALGSAWQGSRCAPYRWLT